VRTLQDDDRGEFGSHPVSGGAPATSDLVGGHLQVIFSPMSESIEHIKAGKLRAWR
jgi:tripartite-type tricarboxylate transporter receptor subunit TctC